MKYFLFVGVITILAMICTFIGERALHYFYLAFLTNKGIINAESLAAAKLAVTFMRLIFLLLMPLMSLYTWQLLVDALASVIAKRNYLPRLSEIAIDVGVVVGIILAVTSYNFGALLDFAETTPLDYYITAFKSQIEEDTGLYLSILACCLWFKALYLLARINPYIGPLLKILSIMSISLFRFSILLTILLVTFASAGMIIFEVPGFASLA